MKHLIGLLLCWCAACAHAAVDANTANEAELDSINGLGPASTARILAARSQGPFADWAELMRRVPGIRAATARKLSSNGLTVNGVPFDAATNADGAPANPKTNARPSAGPAPVKAP
jgi:competence protein ComEA